MKIQISLIVFLLCNLLQAQNFQHFKLDVLIKQLAYANTDIKTKFEKGKMYYLYENNNEKLISRGFDIAYPFFQKSAIVMQNGKYGIIDKNGNYLIKPIYKDFELAPYEHESYIVIFNNNVVFNLNSGVKNVSYTICEEPASPELYSFIGENKKYGVKKEDVVIVKPIYDTIYAVEHRFIIASKNKKIGIIDQDNKKLTDFEYDEVQCSKDALFDYTYPIFGLRKKRTWIYFENGKKLIESNYKCNSFLTIFENSIGIFTLKGQKNILFKNGKILKKYYDFISEDGLIATIGNTIFKIKNNGTDELYFQEN